MRLNLIESSKKIDNANLFFHLVYKNKWRRTAILKGVSESSNNLRKDKK